MDDILIFTENERDHCRHIAKTMEALASEGFKLKISKCEFA
jgi:hypothetical protein